MYVCVCSRIYYVFSKSGFEGNRIEIIHRYSPHTHTDIHWRKIKAAPYQTAATKRRDKNKNNNNNNEIRFYKRNQEIRFYIERYFEKNSINSAQASCRTRWPSSCQRNVKRNFKGYTINMFAHANMDIFVHMYIYTYICASVCVHQGGYVQHKELCEPPTLNGLSFQSDELRPLLTNSSSRSNWQHSRSYNVKLCSRRHTLTQTHVRSLSLSLSAWLRSLECYALERKREQARDMLPLSCLTYFPV